MDDNARAEIRKLKLQAIDESHRFRKGTTALIVVDMQHGFLDEGASLELAKARKLIDPIGRIVDVARGASMPVVFTEFVYATTVPCLRGDPFGIEHIPVVSGEPRGFGFASDNCLIGEPAGEGAESAATVDALKPRPDELVIQGHTYDKFYGTHLDLALRSQDIDRLFICGITTDVCVNATLISGATRNYRVTAISDAMAAVHDHHHDACLEIWENKFARLKTAEEIIGEIAAS